MGKVEAVLRNTEEEVAQYIEAHFFDLNGIMYSAVDVETGEPVAAERLTPLKVPRRADIDPWAYWAYEDSVQNTGNYIDGLVRKYEMTGDRCALERAHFLWLVLRNIYYESQVHGIGSFLRPYGGYEKMDSFMEPLGTDQASPMFSGLYLYMRHCDAATRAEITDVLLNTLRWYARQGFQYFYYKTFIHEWNGVLQHAASYYVPALAWAARVTGEPQWRRQLDEKLALFERPEFTPAKSFCWGSDLPILAELLGERFWQVFDLEKMHRELLEKLSAYNEDGCVRRVCPESAETGFCPSVNPAFDRGKGMGFAYSATRHGGRERPRLEVHALAGLAILGVAGALDEALTLMGHRRRVPHDFAHYLYEDLPHLPEPVELYAGSVGAILVEWWRDYWLLRQAESANACSSTTAF